MARDNLDRHLVSVTKDELKKRATEFIKNWEGHHGERSEAQVFWHEFFAMFNVRSVEIGMYELAAKRATTGGDGRIDYLIPWDLAVEHKSSGEDLFKAMDQLIDYLPSLKQDRPPRLLVTCDFGHFMWHDLETGKEGMFPLSDLVANLDLFWWLAGHEGRGAEVFEDEEAANLKATDLMAKLYDAVMATNYDEHALREWLTRILFCMFADDTDVWPRNAFVNFIHFHTQADGTDLGSQIQLIFQILNTAPGDRPPNLDSELADFTYINGDLFKNTLPMVFGDSEVRTYLLEACRFDWSIISPAIFGSMFQNVMTPAERRHLGAHYTTLENIMKTIRPLFLDDLEAELKTTYTVKALEQFHQKLASLTFFDPACGCGNFLVVAYGELRRLEKECLQKIRAKQGKSDWQSMGINLLFKVTVGQFYGIEIEEFPARIARTALYLMDHNWNRDVSKEFGQYFVRFPIPASPHIAIGNALRMSWNDVLPASEADYVMGNPPFSGHAVRTKEQSDDLRDVWGADYAKWLDFVTGWYRVAIDYDIERRIKFAFVSTNSISQGEQVARLWGPLIKHGYSLDFAYQTFAWTSEARGKAHVHCVIEGFSCNPPSKRRLFEFAKPTAEATVAVVSNISPYLVAGPNLTVEGRSTPISPSMPPVRYGSLPSDGGGLVVLPADYPKGDSVAEKYLRRYVGSQELVNSEDRWVIWMPNGPEPGDVKASEFIRERLERVRTSRLESKNPDTRALANQPYKWFHNAQPTTPYVGIPAQVSESRRYYTVAWLEGDVIASNTLYTALDPDGFLAGLLSSSMFMSWIRVVGGRLKSDLRYAKSIVHNTFPVPIDISDGVRSKVIKAAGVVLDTRTNYPDASLAELYDPLAMPADLVSAHDDLDRAVDALFAPGKKFSTDADRLAVLFERYEALSKAPPGGKKASR
jgi:hypothetical protein